MDSEPNKPIILSEKEIIELKNKPGVVLFYMKRCGYCEILKPTWNKVVRDIKKLNNKDFIIGAIEASNMEKFNKSGHSTSISGFPTILYFSNISKDTELYDGDRSENDLKKWVISKIKKQERVMSGGGKLKRSRKIKSKTSKTRKIKKRKSLKSRKYTK